MFHFDLFEYLLKIRFSMNLIIEIEILLELVSMELNHLAAILHVYARGLIFMK